MYASKGEIIFRQGPENGKRKEINCIGGEGISEDDEVQEEERVLLWIHFRCGEASLGSSSIMCSISLCGRGQGSSLRGGWEPEECVKDLWERRKETTREQMWRAVGRAGFRWICTLCLYISAISKIIHHS